MNIQAISSQIISKEKVFPVKIISFTFCLLLLNTMLFSQDCHCNVEQVQDNSVEACDLIIGTVVEVSTVVTLRNAINQANNSGGNTTILIADGTYQIASTASFPYITADNVVFRSQSGNRDAVIISGEGMVPTSSTENGFLIAGNNVTIADLTIKDVGNHGIQVSGHNLFVHNVKIQDTYEQMIKGSTADESVDSAIVQCSIFEYTAGLGPNWYIGGLDIHKGKDWIVRDNVFRNISSPGISLAEHAIHFWDNSINNIVERNVIYNCDRGIGFGLGENGPQNVDGIIRNNMIYNDGTSQFHDVGIGLESSPGTKVFNNSIYIEYPNAIEYRFTTTTNVQIVNNLTNQAITSRNGGTGILATNFSNAQSDWFMDLSTGNLRLSNTQVNVTNQGTALTNLVLDDIDQNIRPIDNPYDIGASEISISGLTTIESTPHLSASPNPAQGQTILRSSQILKQGSLKVFDINGKKLISLDGISGNEIVLQVKDLVPGIYHLVLSEKEGVIATLKLVVE